MKDVSELKIYCIIPAYNEARHIANVVDQVKKYVPNVIVVDDGSDDLTGEIARRQGAIVLRHIINRDQGAALETGDQYALSQEADIIVHFDADEQFLADEIPDMIAPLLAREYDIVFGSRFLSKRSNIPLLKKFILLPLASLVNRLLLGVKMTDPQSGFRALSHEAARQIVISQDGKAHCSEILAKAIKNNLRIKEVPITVIYHDFGQRFSGGFRIVKDILLAKLNER